MQMQTEAGLRKNATNFTNGHEFREGGLQIWGMVRLPGFEDKVTVRSFVSVSKVLTPRNELEVRKTRSVAIRLILNAAFLSHPIQYSDQSEAEIERQKAAFLQISL